MAVDLLWLLDKLCADLGFCLPPREQERILALDFADADALTRDILTAEGLDSRYCDCRRYAQVLETVQRYCFPPAEPDIVELQRRLMKPPGKRSRT